MTTSVAPELAKNLHTTSYICSEPFVKPSGHEVVVRFGTALRKAERRAGLPDSAAITRERSGRVGDYSYRYRMTQQCRQALQGVIPERQNGEAAA